MMHNVHGPIVKTIKQCSCVMLRKRFKTTVRLLKLKFDRKLSFSLLKKLFLTKLLNMYYKERIIGININKCLRRTLNDVKVEKGVY